MSPDLNPRPWWDSSSTSVQVSRSRVRSAVGAVISCLVVGVFLVAALVQPSESPQMTREGTVVMPQTLSQIVARCGGEHLLAPVPEGKDPGEGDVWAFLGVRPGVSHSGSNSLAARSGVYFRSQEVEIESVRVALEDGAVVVWYSDALPQSSFAAAARITTDVAENFQVPVLMVPLPEELVALGESSPILIAESGRYVSCQIPSIDVLGEFVDAMGFSQ